MTGKTEDFDRNEETLEEVLDRANTADLEREVTERRLKRWRDEGLVPSPRKEGLGRGRGTTAYYPSGTGDLVRAIAKELESGPRSLSRVALALWFRGYPLTSYVREWLLDGLRGVDRHFRAAYRAYNGEITDRPVTQWVDRDRIPHFGRVRGKVGRAEFFHPALYVLEAVAGEVDEDELRDRLSRYQERSDATEAAFIETVREAGFEGVDQLEIEGPEEELAQRLGELSDRATPGSEYERACEKGEEEWEALRDEAVAFVDRWLPDTDEREGYSFLVFRWLLLYPEDWENPVELLREDLETDRSLPTDSVEEFFRIALGGSEL